MGLKLVLEAGASIVPNHYHQTVLDLLFSDTEEYKIVLSHLKKIQKHIHYILKQTKIMSPLINIIFCFIHQVNLKLL